MQTFQPHFVVVAILEITQHALSIDQTHRFNVSLLNIYTDLSCENKKQKRR